MLSKTQRLTSNRIDYLLRKGKKTGDAFLTLKYLHTPNAISRFCVIVSSKILAKAVERNHLRRQIYEIIRNNQHLLHASFDVIVIARSPLARLGFQQLTATITSLLQNLKANS